MCSRSPAGVPSRRSESCSLACRHAALLDRSTSGPCSTEESVAIARRCRRASPDASMGFGSTRFRCCRAGFYVAPPSIRISAGRFAPRFQPLWRPPSRVSREGKESRLCLAPSNQCWCAHPKMHRPPVWLAGSPKTAALPFRPTHSPEGTIGIGRYWLRCLPKEAPRPRFIQTPKGPAKRQWSTRRATPHRCDMTKRNPPRRSVSPEGARSPTHRIVTPKSGIATQCSAPEGWHRRFELLPSILLRSPAYMMVGWLAADSHHPKVGSSARHSRASRRNRYAVPCYGTPEGIASARRTAWPPEGGPFTARDSGSVSSKLEWPVSGQTVIVFIKTAETEVPSSTRRPMSRRRSVGGAVDPRIPPRRVVIPMGTEVLMPERTVARSRRSRPKSKARSFQLAPKRFPKPRPA